MSAFPVIAKSISPTQIVIECPFCYTRYKRDGTPTKRAKHPLHNHGNQFGTTTNGSYGSRVSHCVKVNNVYELIVTDETVRINK